MASLFVAELRAGSEVRRDQLRRIATSAVIGRRQALDALCRLRAEGLVQEDLAGIARLEHCGEWSALWTLVGRRLSEIEADEREAALAGDAAADPRARTDRNMAEAVRLEGLLYEERRKVQALEEGTGVGELRQRLDAAATEVESLKVRLTSALESCAFFRGTIEAAARERLEAQRDFDERVDRLRVELRSRDTLRNFVRRRVERFWGAPR